MKHVSIPEPDRFNFIFCTQDRVEDLISYNYTGWLGRTECFFEGRRKNMKSNKEREKEEFCRIFFIQQSRMA
jgi:hypothetical protein